MTAHLNLRVMNLIQNMIKNKTKKYKISAQVNNQELQSKCEKCRVFEFRDRVEFFNFFRVRVRVRAPKIVLVLALIITIL